MLVGYFGRDVTRTARDNAGRGVHLIEPTLDTWGVAVFSDREPGRPAGHRPGVSPQRRAQRRGRRAHRRADELADVRRVEAIAALVAGRGDALTVTTEQAIGAWRAAVPEPANEIPDHLDVVGCMGSASTIALGIALARPERKVIIVDGDGSLLMQLGSLVTIAGAAPPNLFHFVFENGVYETSGQSAAAGRGTV